MTGERVIKDIPNNAMRLVEDVRPSSGKPFPQSVMDAANRVSSANRRVFNRYLGGITSKLPFGR